MLRELAALRKQVERMQTTEHPSRANTSATTPPSATNDATVGYTVGSLWIDTVTDTAYLCCDASTAAAVWKQIT